MSKGKLERQLLELSRLRAAEPAEVLVEPVRAALTSKSNLVVAKAAYIVTERGLEGLEPELVAAFWRFMDDPQRTDKGCTAKHRLVEALYAIGSDAETVFLRAVRHVQMEPVWAGEIDTAVELRAHAALALVRMSYPDVMTELVQLLADSAADARLGACRAITYAGYDVGALLLRFKVLTGDEDPRVIGACFDGLLAIQPESALALVTGFLADADDAVVEAAALALGDSRRREALVPLRAAFDGSRSRASSVRRVLLLAIALLRSDDALDQLLDLVARGSVPDATDAVGALAIDLHDADLLARVQVVVDQRGDPGLRAALRDAVAHD